MVKFVQSLERLEKFALLIVILFICGILIGKFSEYFRMTPDLKWIYRSGKLISHLLFFGSILWSLINTILIFKKSSWKNNLVWILISILPVLYFSIMMTIVMTSSI